MRRENKQSLRKIFTYTLSRHPYQQFASWSAALRFMDEVRLGSGLIPYSTSVLVRDVAWYCFLERSYLDLAPNAAQNDSVLLISWDEDRLLRFVNEDLTQVLLDLFQACDERDLWLCLPVRYDVLFEDKKNAGVALWRDFQLSSFQPFEEKTLYQRPPQQANQEQDV